MSARRQFVCMIVAAAVLLGASAVRLLAVPSAPINLTAIVVGSTVTLTWNSTSLQPLFGHRFEAGSASQLSNLARFLISPSTTFVVPNVPAGTYFVRVRAVGVDGDSAPSNEVVVSVVGSSCTTLPEPPVNFTSTVNGSLIALNWSSGAGCPTTNFIVHAGSAPFSSDLGVMSLGDTLSFAASAAAGTYYLRLYAENQYGSSSPSNEVMAVVVGGGGGGGGSGEGYWDY
jgi:predicted phage tail protein